MTKQHYGIKPGPRDPDFRRRPIRNYTDAIRSEGAELAEQPIRPGDFINTVVAKWQPIESAPKDVGVAILLSVPTKCQKWNASLPLAGWWMGSYWAIFNADEAVQRVEPTHWMPLPPAP